MTLKLPSVVALFAWHAMLIFSPYPSRAQCSKVGGHCVLYLPGAGSATDQNIDRRINDFHFVFEHSGVQNAEVKIIRADGGYLPQTGPNLRWYSSANEDAAVQFIQNHQGRNLHVVMSSAGAIFFRDRVLPRLANKQFGIVIEVEPMFPGATPPTAPPAGYDPQVHVTMETQYTGDLAPAFKALFGVGGTLMPGCGPPTCYQLKNGNFEINSLSDAVFEGIRRHAVGVVNGENRAESIESIGIRDGTQTLVTQLSALVAASPAQGPPTSPPQQGTVVPPISGGGGSGAANGGGVGVESFPTWIDFKTYREQLNRVAPLDKIP